MYNGDYRGYLIERFFDGNYGMDILGGIANTGLQEKQVSTTKAPGEKKGVYCLKR
jgi:hypothetical protein